MKISQSCDALGRKNSRLKEPVPQRSCGRRKCVGCSSILLKTVKLWHTLSWGPREREGDRQEPDSTKSSRMYYREWNPKESEKSLRVGNIYICFKKIYSHTLKRVEMCRVLIALKISCILVVLCVAFWGSLLLALDEDLLRSFTEFYILMGMLEAKQTGGTSDESLEKQKWRT